MNLKTSYAVYACLIAFMVALGGCKQIAQVSVPVYVEPEYEPLVVPNDSSNVVFEGLNRKQQVLAYYRRHGAGAVWIYRNSNTPQADSLTNIIQNSIYYGLPAGRYHAIELENLVQNSSSAALRKEVLLTDAFFTFCNDIKSGVERPLQDGIDSLQLDSLQKIVTEGGMSRYLQSQEPKFSAYAGLKKAMRLTLDSVRFRQLDSGLVNHQVRLISINLERWRAETSSFGNRYIFVNIPSFFINVVQNDSVVLSSRAVVGAPKSATPVLSSIVECVTIYPYWHVPRKIAIAEYLPTIKSDTSYLAKHNFDVLDRKGNLLNPDSVNWNRFHKNFFPVVLRQREGPENALGVIKFVFDNPYAVYIHDTNAKRLFRNKDRALSHGCVRMEKAVDLAHYLVTGVAGKEAKTITKYLKEKQRHWIDLKNPMPIYMRYLTCEFKNNSLQIYQDIYGKDQILYDLLFGVDRKEL